MRETKGEPKGFYLSAKDQHFHLMLVHDMGAAELLKSNDKIKLKMWTNVVITFLDEKRELTLYIDGKKQDYASIWQGIDFFSSFAGIPSCTFGNIPDFRLGNKYQLFGSVMDFYLLNCAVSDDYIDSLRGKFDITSHIF